MIEQIIKLREEGLSFRKIAVELDTTVGRVQYRWNKWLQNHLDDNSNQFLEKETESSEDQPMLHQSAKVDLQIKLVSPLKIIALWDVSQLPKKLIELYFNQNIDDLVHVIRIYDVKNIIFNGKNAHYHHEIPIPYKNGHWFIKGLKPNRSYIAELGVYLSEKVYFPILRSNSIETLVEESPNEDASYVDFNRTQQFENVPPKWKDHVSTYSFYEETKILEGKNERNIIPTR